MKKHSTLARIIICLLSFFLLHSNSVKAENVKPAIDSVCCPPDSLTVTSVIGELFCVRWKVAQDSNCKAPIGFIVEWKLLVGTLWHSKTVTYTSGAYVQFCDTADCQGATAWRVRTICNDNSLSDWVPGNKFIVACDHDRPVSAPKISVSPNPSSSSVFVTGKFEKVLDVMITVTSITGDRQLEKSMHLINGKLSLPLSIANWRQGTYYITVSEKNRVLAKTVFLKE